MSEEPRSEPPVKGGSEDEPGEVSDQPVLVPDLGPRPVDRPPGWTFFSGVDERVAVGLRTPESRRFLSRAPWLLMPDGSPSIDEIEHLGAIVFEPGTTYEPALFALVQSVGLVGMVPGEPARAALAELGVTPTALGRPEPPESVGEVLPRDVVYLEPVGDGEFLLNLTAPFGFEPESRRIYAPSYEFPEWLSGDQVELMVRYAGLTNRLLPLLARLNVLRPHASQVASAGAKS